MRGTELLVPSMINAKLQRASESRLSRLAAQAQMERRDPCHDPRSPDCVSNLKPINRPA
ncbi:hypothetical protein BH24CHL6_BH24CHL6_09740 [soil metagenome]